MWGIFFGFQMAGFKSKFALEIDEWASKLVNLIIQNTILTKDIKKVNPQIKFKKLMELLVDPCQGFFLK